MIVWIDGWLGPAETARIDPRDRGFTLGDGLYETIRVKEGTAVRLDRHLSRLDEGLRLLDFPSIDHGTLRDSIRAVLASNGLTEASVRLTITRGVAARGMMPDPKGLPTIVVSAAPYVAPSPARLIIASVTRRNEHSPLSRIKTTNCLDSVMARMEAGQRGADEAVLLNAAGLVAETSAANIFAVIAGRVITPRVTDGALPGVMRGFVFERQSVEERSLQPSDLTTAQEVFLTSSLGIRPVVALEGTIFPVGPVCTGLLEEI